VTPQEAADVLRAESRVDYRLPTLSSEDLMRLSLDAIVALSFRVGKPPGETIEALWKTLIPDKAWKDLIAADLRLTTRG
jgi:hypothetical protein